MASLIFTEVLANSSYLISSNLLMCVRVSNDSMESSLRLSMFTEHVNVKIRNNFSDMIVFVMQLYCKLEGFF